MKKWLVCLLVLALLIPSALAESFDVTGMSDDELEALNLAVQLELFSRHAAGSGVEVPQGSYVVGVDLPSGRYHVTVGDDVFAASGYVLDAESDKYIDTFDLGSMFGVTTANINLDDGCVLRIEHNSVLLRVYTGLF